MRSPDFGALRRDLVSVGVATGRARRAATELADHYADLHEELVAQGMSAETAEDVATERLGNLRVVVKAAAARTELRSWVYRYPRLGRIALPIACALALPIAPLAVGANYVPVIARWGAIFSLSAVITASMFLAIQLAITFG